MNLRVDENFRDLISTLPFPINIVDENRSVLYVSESLEKQFSDETYGQKCWLFFSDDKKPCRGCPLDQPIKTGVTQKVEIEDILNGKTCEISHTGIIFEGRKAVLEVFVDITKRKNEEYLRVQAENHFKMILQTEPECVKIMDAQNNLLEMNAAGLKMIDATSLDQVKNLFVPQLISEPYRQGFVELTEKVFSGESGRYEFELNSLKGTKRWMETHAVPMRDANGDVTALLALTRDATARKQNEERLRESEQQLRTLIDAIPDAIFFKDGDGKWTLINKVAEEMFRLQRIDYKQKNDIELIELVPSRNNELLFCIDSDNHAWQNKKLTRSEEYMELDDGLIHYYDVMKLPLFNEDGSRKGLVIVGRDITEKKKVEQELLNAGKAASDYKYALDQSANISITDSKGTIVYVNENFCNVSGFSSEELLGNNHNVVSSEYHTAEFWKLMWHEIMLGHVFRADIKNKTKGGDFFWSDTTIVPLLDGNKNPFQFLAIRYDITKRKNAEMELAEKNAELQKTNSELDRFVYSTSHDLRSPLTSILGLVGIISNETQEEETKTHITMIGERIKLLDDFIKQILGYSHNKRMMVNRTKINFREIIDLTIKTLSNLEKANRISFNIDLNDGDEFYSDPNRIQTIFNNLISNAIKYSEPNRENPFISISIKTSPYFAEIVISDNGIGIPAEYQSKVFDMFFRLSNQEGSTGIGLYLVSEIVNSLHGTITLTSEPNKGTEFIIKLSNLDADGERENV